MVRPLHLSDMDDKFKLFQYLTDKEKLITQLQHKMAGLENSPVNTQANVNNPRTVDLTQNDFLGIRDALQIRGSATIALDGLPGLTGQPQTPLVSKYTTLPALNDPVNFEGRLVAVGTTLYRFNGTSVPVAWEAQTATSSAHNALSVSHGDTLAGTVVRGDLITGNATPQWARVPRGTANQALRMDAAGNDPGWGSIADSILTSNIALLNRNSQTFTGTPQIFNGLEAIYLTAFGANGEYAGIASRTELLTLSTVALTTDTADTTFLPGKSILFWNVWRVTTTISGGGITSFTVGDATTPARFNAGTANLVVGSTGYGLSHFHGSVTTDAAGPNQPSNARLRITCNAIPTQGVIRITQFYIFHGVPTS